MELESLTMNLIYRELLGLIEAGRPCALATLVSASGSSPQETGAKVIFLPDGRIIGTIGGGCLEVEARRIGLEAIRSRTCRLFDLRLDDDFGWDDGLICGGKVHIFINPIPERSAEAYAAALASASDRKRAALCTVIRGAEEKIGTTVFLREDVSTDAASGLESVAAETIASGNPRTLDLLGGESVYIEPILPRPSLIIAGAGHIGASLAQVASLCGFEVTIVDDRPSFANRERLPFADRVVVEEIPRFIRESTINEDTYVVIVTRGHRNDARCLRECIGSSAKYIGMIGSKRKIVVIYEELLREGLATREQLLRVHAPLGLTLGDVDVGEIAVSIMAELIAVRRGMELDSIRSMQYVPPILCEEPKA